MSSAIAFGIATLVASLICCIFGLTDDAGGVIISLTLAVICAIGTIVSVERANNPSPKTIRCTSIEQIDTLYKNDSIVGYEIVIWEDSK